MAISLRSSRILYDTLILKTRIFHGLLTLLEWYLWFITTVNYNWINLSSNVMTIKSKIKVLLPIVILCNSFCYFSFFFFQYFLQTFYASASYNNQTLLFKSNWKSQITKYSSFDKQIVDSLTFLYFSLTNI